MSRRTLFRGQPVLLLAGVCGGWVALRIALIGGGETVAAELPGAAPNIVSVAASKVPERGFDGMSLAGNAALVPVPLAHQKLRFSGGAKPLPRVLMPYRPLNRADYAGEFMQSEPRRHGGANPQAAAVQPGTALVHAAPAPAGAERVSPVVLSSAARWGGDGWVLLRDDGGARLNPGRPSYGRSQAGAVLRYRLDDGGGHRLQAYGRMSTALAGTHETDLAVGLSGRPLAAVPVRVAAELRGTDHAAGTDLRPSLYAVTELAPLALPLGVRGEAYIQAGYVGGTNATAFVDGQVRVDRGLIRAGPVEGRVGAGVWGGAQEGSQRLDTGPSVTARLPVGPVRASLSLDYRFRVAGNAAPSDGPALTVSAGF